MIADAREHHTRARANIEEDLSRVLPEIYMRASLVVERRRMSSQRLAAENRDERGSARGWMEVSRHARENREW